MSGPPDWIRRFTAPTIGFPHWSADRPSQVAYTSTESGSWQVWALDLETGARRQVTEDRVGIEDVQVAPGGRIVWWSDDSGDERGRWLVQPFEGGHAEALFPEIPLGWDAGLTFAESHSAVGVSPGHADFRIYIVSDRAEPTLVYRHDRACGIGREDAPGRGLSADGRYLCIRHGENGDLLHSAVRVFDLETGQAIADLMDPGRTLEPTGWSPVRGDERLVVSQESGPFERPAIWDLSTGERTNLEVDLPGAVFPVDWWPDGSAILVRQEHEGLDRLHRLDLGTGRTDVIADPHGDISAAAVRPDGHVWFLASTSTTPPRVLSDDGAEVFAAVGDRAPAGRPFRSHWFRNEADEPIQAWVVEPAGAGPHPLVVSVHGGPEWHRRDEYAPETQAWVDAGYAVALPNYRGSTGYGVEFRQRLIHDIGFPETEDIIACVDSLIAGGVADPGLIFFAGWSWGGYLACLNEGLNPDRWRAVFAGIPTGDYVAAHWNCAPSLQAWDDAIMGGSPDEVPELYRERDPMTYVENAKAPVLVIAGENDSRCPIEGVTPWVDAVRAQGVEVSVHLYPTGHHANDTQVRANHMQLILDFFGRHRRAYAAAAAAESKIP